MTLTIAALFLLCMLQCLLATGGAPKNLPVLETAAPEVQAKVSVFRRLHDYANLDGVLLEKNVKDIVVVGGGFLGSELAVALAHRGREHGVRVTQIYREKGNMAKVTPPPHIRHALS